MSKKIVIQSLLAVLSFVFLFGCATKEPAELPSFTALHFDANQFESKVENFVVILDASSSMRHDYNGNAKFTTAKTIAQRLNMTLPELGQTAGLRSFGHHPSFSKNKTELLFGMETYTTKGIADGLENIVKPGGTSPLGIALDAAQADLDGLAGIYNAVVVISDGKDMTNVREQAQDLKNRYGSSLCIYTVLVGDAPEGRQLLQDVADGTCGFFTTADDIMTNAGMAAFVKNAFLKEKSVSAPAPAPAPAPERKDSDGDGVYDDEDQCPGTPEGARVNAVGCWTLDNVLFDFDKAVIKPEAYSLLDEVAAIMKKNPAMSVEIQGHTDNIGTKAYNKDLSMRRATAVAEYLVKKGILRNRMATTGFGFTKPVALNGTKFGRSLNRRVELHPY